MAMWMERAGLTSQACRSPAHACMTKALQLAVQCTCSIVFAQGTHIMPLCTQGVLGQRHQRSMHCCRLPAAHRCPVPLRPAPAAKSCCCTDWVTMKFPPPQGAQNKGKTDYTRRRRWVRSRRQLTPRDQACSAAASVPNLMDMDQEPSPAAPAQSDEERVVVGVVQPQEFLPLPPGWQSSGAHEAAAGGRLLDANASWTVYCHGFGADAHV